LIVPAALVSRHRGVGSALLTVLCAAHLSPAARADAPPASVRFVETRVGAGLAKPFALAVVDWNGDGRLDLAVTDLGSGTVTLLLADGDGTYRRSAAFAAGRIPRGVVAADVNADGKADLVVAGGQGNTAVVILGDGGGSGEVRSFAARIAPFHVAVADLDGDTHLDVAVANESNVEALRGKGEVSLLFGDGRGDFRRGPVLAAGSNPADVKAADLNGDGRLDLAVVNWDSRDVSLFFALADGGFSSASSVSYGGAAAYTLALDDLDDDRTPELIVGDARGDVSVLRRQAGGSFAVAERAHADRGLRSLAVADLDGDGRRDVATANTGAGTVSVLLHRADGFAPPAHFAVGKGPRSVVAADMDADGAMDLVVTNGASGDVSILLNAGGTTDRRLREGATVRPSSTPIREPARASFDDVRVAAAKDPFGVAAADFDADGRIDLAVTSTESEEVLLLAAGEGGTFARRTAFRSGKGARGIAAADLDGDGDPDLVVASAPRDSVYVWLGDGKGGGRVKEVGAGVAPFQVAVADLNGDGRLDIAVADESNLESLREKGRTSVLFGDGRGGFEAGPVLESATNPADVKVADFDGDRHADLAVVNWGSGDVSLYRGRGEGRFAPATRLAMGEGPAYGIVLADLDGDGDIDLAAGKANGFVPVFSNDGAGNLRPAMQVKGGAGLRGLTAADLNGDGRPDLATADTAGHTVTILLARAKGGFTIPYAVNVGKNPRSVVAADVDADGRTDLVVTNGGSDDVSILLNR
jgi:hypothetical protein